MEYSTPLVDEQLAGNPRYDPFARSTRSRLFLITFEFQSHQYGVTFHSTAKARNQESARRKAERYLDAFYGPKRESRRERHGDTWYYHDGEVTVDLYAVEEATPEQVVTKLLIT